MSCSVCAGYIPANGVNALSLQKINFGKITHAFLAFSTLKKNENGNYIPCADDTLKNAVSLVREEIYKTGCKTSILVSIGGAGADGFCEASSTAEGRMLFAKECQRLISENKLDGIDMDWEFPGLSHVGIKACEHCTDDFILLLSEIRSAIGSKLLTVAVGSDHWNRVDNFAVNRLCDLINVMTYDMNNTAHCAMDLTAAAIEGWHTHGIDAEKLVLGVPFYARCANPKYEWYGYNRLMELVNDKKASLLSTKQQEYVVLDNERLSIDTPLSIKKKIDYIMQNGFAGIFCWQELSDYNGELRDAMYGGLHKFSE